MRPSVFSCYNDAMTKRTRKNSKHVLKKTKQEGAVASAFCFPGGGFFWLLLLFVTIAVASLPVAAARIMNDETVTGAFFAPLVLWGGVTLLALWWSRQKSYSGERGFVILTCLLLGLGIVEQLRLGTWESSWTALRAYAPLLVGVVGFLFGVRFVSAKVLAMVLPRIRWMLWLCAMGTFGVLVVFGRSYRGGLFLPGQMNPTELVKFFLVLFAASWLPSRVEGFSRTFCGIPVPPLRDSLALAVVWGLPVLGAVVVRDLGLVLILCLTLVLMLTALTRRVGWIVLGGVLATFAACAVQLLSTHSRARFEVWLHPFSDPLGKGWQIAQSLCAQYAGGLWGMGLGEGTPGAVSIVTSDFIYAAIAEEWGLVGCALLMGLFWLWLVRILRGSALALTEELRLLGAGIASVLGVQIVLNVGGVTKALPMTGITLPFFSQGGFSLLTVLLMCGVVAVVTKRSAT